MSNYKAELKNIENIDKNIKICFVSGDFNKKYVDKLEEANETFLRENGFNNITKFRVPGVFEVPGFVERIIKIKGFDLIITGGVVIRGATTHYDYVAGDTARKIMDLTVKHRTPLIFGILTCENDKQVIERINPHYAIAGLNLISEIEKL